MTPLWGESSDSENGDVDNKSEISESEDEQHELSQFERKDGYRCDPVIAKKRMEFVDAIPKYRVYNGIEP